MKVLIFAGPSISEKKSIKNDYKNFIFLPPLKHADLISNVEHYKPDIIGIIDDYSGKFESVWHNEIVYVLEKGIKVFGAAGVGAIRAFELEKFGMIGVGKVYNFFKDKLIFSDEEVICLFNEDNGFKRITVPLINIRFTLDRLKINSDIFKIVKEIFWKERTKDKIIAKLKESKVDESTIYKVFENFYDVQLEDSLLLLNSIRELSEKNLKKDYKDPEIIDGNLFIIMYERDRKVKNNKGETTLNNIANYSILNHPDSEDMVFNALNREIVAFLAGYLNVEVDDEEINLEKERLLKKFKIENLEEWLKENDINSKDFYNIIKKIALCRKMQKWFLGRRKYKRTTAIINEELILRGDYKEYKEKAINLDESIDEDKLREKFNRYNGSEITAIRMKREKFPWNVNPFQGAKESGISKLDFKMVMSKEEVVFDKIRDDILKILS